MVLVLFGKKAVQKGLFKGVVEGLRGLIRGAKGFSGFISRRAAKVAVGKAAPKIGPKIQKQMVKGGWPGKQIRNTIQKGKQIRAVNKATGNPGTRYVDPKSGKSVVLDDVTSEVIHVGGPGFKYGPRSGDIPGPR